MQESTLVSASEKLKTDIGNGPNINEIDTQNYSDQDGFSNTK